MTIQQQQYNIVIDRYEFRRDAVKTRNEKMNLKGILEMEKTEESLELTQDNMLDLMKNIDNANANLKLMMSYFSMLSYAMQKSKDEPLNEKAVSLYLALINDNTLDNLQYVTENAVNTLEKTNNGLSYFVDKLEK